MLVESPHIENGVVDSNWVQKSAYKGQRFSEKECAVVAQLANSLRPFAPKRTLSDEGYYEEPQAHVANQAALVRIANTFLMGTGYHQFTQLESPRVSPSSLRALALGPVGIYETLCARTAGHYDIQDVNGTLLSNYADITTIPGNKRAVMGSFFDMETIDATCHSHGLSFADR